MQAKDRYILVTKLDIQQITFEIHWKHIFKIPSVLVRALRLHGWAVLVILLDVTNKRTNLSALGQKVVEEFAESNFRLDRDPLSNELCMVQVKKTIYDLLVQ